MKSFQVLNQEQHIHQNYILEASAGTGKTFSIENIVVRLLLEPDPRTLEPLLLENILIVTFTRAAARDLKQRIRSNIVKTLELIELQPQASYPEFLIDFINKYGEKIAKKRLEQALFCFDLAQIFTIHGFCHKALSDFVLEGGISLAALKEEPGLPLSKSLEIINDFFRSSLQVSLCTKAQLKRLLSSFYKGDVEKLKNDLLIKVSSKMKVEPAFTLNEILKRINEERQLLLLDSEKILEDYDTIASSYLKSDREKIRRFAALFDKRQWTLEDIDILIEDDVYIAYALHPSQLKKKVKQVPPLKHYPSLLSSLEASLCPLITLLRSPQNIFSCLAEACQHYFRKVMNKEELIGFDDILVCMHKASQQDSFRSKIQQRYQAAIIDEFQDTDPTQWEIFENLFMKGQNPGYIYLVGDPKQSIYAFRQADIYTYLQASESLGAEAKYSLDTNFRSQPPLTEALNRLFSEQNAPGWISLPKIKDHLPYQDVKAGHRTSIKHFKDNKGAVHFLSYTGQGDEGKDAEKEILFPYIAAEISRLVTDEGFNFKQCAVLVKDRFQADRLLAIFKKYNIPATNQKLALLSDSPALLAMIELLEAIMHPKDLSKLKTALGGVILGFTAPEVKALEDPSKMEPFLAQWYHLRSILFEKGFASCFRHLVEAQFKPHVKVSEFILTREGGDCLYNDLQHIAEVLMEYQTATQATPLKLVAYLEELIFQKEGDGSAIKRRLDPSKDGVKILTIHSSKGLEYDIVFAIGLIGRTQELELMLPDRLNTSLVAIPNADHPLFKEHAEELDAEKMRQLYVALTRAKYRVYIPIFFNTGEKPPKLGTASPIELFTARFGQPKLTYNEVYEKIGCKHSETFHSLLSCMESNQIKYSRLEHENGILSDIPKSQLPRLKAPEKIAIPGKSLFIHSFSNLAKSHPHDYKAKEEPQKNNGLPSNNEVGNLLHLILESISFESCTDVKKTCAAVHPFLVKTPYEQWSEHIAAMIFNTLNTSLPLKTGPVELSGLNLDHIYKETEFLYPIDQPCSIPECHYVEGFLKGIIDLVFHHEGFYYLLDWKSNWLGNYFHDYSKEKLSQAMLHNQYTLQAAIYKEALKRYLKLVDPRPFEEIYGGAVYVFLRGIHPANLNNEGIYYIE